MSKRPGQATVRANRFEERLGQVQMDMRREIGSDMALVMVEYHNLKVAPLAEQMNRLTDENRALRTRINRLERVTSLRAWRWLRARWRGPIVSIADLAPDPETEAA
jgi:hypothetical protein